MKQAILFVISLLTLTGSALADLGGASATHPALIIDVRTEVEYQQGHVRNALNIPHDQIAARIAAIAPDHDARIVLYCRSGRRSRLAEQTLRQLGYSHVENQGGLDDMERAGYPTK